MNKRKKATKIVLTVIITLAVVTGLFIARTYLKGKVEIFAEKAVTETVLKYKSVANGDFSKDALTDVVKQGKKLILKTTNEKLAKEGTIEGQINLKSATALTKMKVGVSNLKPAAEETNRVNLEVNLSKDGQNWSKTYSSSHTTTINFAQVLSNSATKYKSIKYKITLETFKPNNTSSTPALTALTVWGKGTAGASPTPSVTVSASATVTSTASGTNPPTPPGPGDTVTPPNPPGPGDTVTPPNPPGPGDSVTPVVPLLTATPEPSETPEETATTSPGQTKVASSSLFNSPGSSVLVSGIQSGVSFVVLIAVVLGIGAIVIYRIAKSKE